MFLIAGLQNCYSDNNIEISLLTCSGGEESFTSWGHSAIRVIDRKQSYDLVYNFGLFDFDTPNFYAKFIKGNLKYKLGIQETSYFFESYISENRQIVEQKLNLSDENKIKIINQLEYLYKPKNRYYYYNFLSKNCTTELRNLIFKNSDAEFLNQKTNKSYRTLINESLTNKPWLKFGINLIFGAYVDKKIDTYESMFLPNSLSSELNKTKVNGKNLVFNERVFNENKIIKSNFPFFLNPLFIFSIISVFVLIINSSKIQISLLLVTGISGILILLISIFTEHQELKNNFNLLWCNPLYILSAVLQLTEKKQIQMYLSILLQVLMIGVIIMWIIQFQRWEIVFFPFALILSIYNFRIIKTGYNNV